MFLALALATSAACTTEDELSPEDLAEDEDAFADEELDDEFRAHYAAMTQHFEVVQDDSHASKATGAVYIPIRDAQGNIRTQQGKQVRGTCGVTFIAPHYAITAAHCVSSTNVPDPPNNPLWVLQYDASDVHPWWFAFASQLSGTFPNYNALVDLYQSGLTMTYQTCKVVSRCDNTWGRYNCNHANMFDDVALLHCASRSNTQWIPVAGSDAGNGGAVEMYWFHELLDMPLTDPGPGDPEEKSRFDRYTVLGDPAWNFHYLEAPPNVLLPLRSKPWPGGTPRTRVSGTETDLYGCHGSSGSGVFQRNAQNNLELLGPAKFSIAPTWPTNRLCADPNFTAGTRVLGYESNAATRRLQSLFQFTLQWDRNPIVWNPGPFFPFPG